MTLDAFALQKENNIESASDKQFKEANRITPSDTIEYGHSDHVQSVRSWVEAETGTKKTMRKTTISKAWAARNFLIMMIVLINGCR